MTLRELCERYNIEYDSKHGKECRQQVAKHCLFEQHGRNYIIIRELSENEKLAMTGKFTEYLADLLIKHLDGKGTDVTYTYAEVYEKMGMINDKWRSGRSNFYNKESYKQASEITKFNYLISQDELDEGLTDYKIIKYNLRKFFKLSNKLLKEIVLNSLDSMERRHLILYDKTYKLYILPKAEGEKIKERNITDKERSMILDWTNEALEMLGYKTEWIPNEEDKNKFDDYMDAKIFEYFGYDTYAKAVKIILAPNGLKREAFRIDCRHQLNQNIQSKLLESKEMDNIIRSLNKQFIKEYIKI